MDRRAFIAIVGSSLLAATISRARSKRAESGTLDSGAAFVRQTVPLRRHCGNRTKALGTQSVRPTHAGTAICECAAARDRASRGKRQRQADLSLGCPDAIVGVSWRF
jgi:hypothetical protein